MNNLIDRHKRMAMGEPIEGGGDCESAFGHGRKIHDDGSAKMKHLSEEKRATKHLGRVADHGPHGMAVPRDGQSDNF